MTKTYSELRQLKTFEERYNYCRLKGGVGTETFGYDRYLNQNFYRSAEWKRIRDEVIVRDGACDLGLKDHPISGRIYIHHLNPLSVEDITESTDALLDPNNLICVSHATHNAIHYGDDTVVRDKTYVERKPNDTTLWRRNQNGRKTSS